MQSDFFGGEVPIECERIDGRLHRLKIGEIYQLSDSSMSMTCINCTQEFQYFTEFSLHIQEHYVRGEIARLNEIKKEASDDLPCSEVQADGTELKLGENNHGDDEDVEMHAYSEELLPEFNCEVIENDDFDQFDLDGGGGGDWADEEFNETSHSIFNCEQKMNSEADSKQKQEQPLQFIDGTDYEKCHDKFKCLTCDHESDKWYQMKEHLITHITPKDVKCPICSKLFASVSYVRKHCSRTHNVRVSAIKIKEAQSSSNPVDIATLKRPKEVKMMYSEGVDYEKVDQKFQCVTCHRVMAKFDHMKEHLLTHNSEKNVYCPFCARAFITESYVRKHVNRTHKKKITADEIKAAQASIDVNQIKMQWTIEKDKATAKANRMFQQKTAVNPASTSTAAAAAATTTDDGTICCFFCAKRFTKARYAQKHMRLIHAKPYTIAEVMNSNLRNNAGESHQIASSAKTDVVVVVEPKTESTDQLAKVEQAKSFECFECHKKYVSFASTRIHLKLHSRIKYQCPHCDKLFALKSYVRDHIVIMHGIKRDDIPKESILQASSNLVCNQRQSKFIAFYECYLCKKQYKKRNRLREHMLIHFDGPYLCVICGTVYKTNDTLRHHMERHKTDQPVKCPQCHKTYPTRRYMLSHYRTIHLNKRSATAKKNPPQTIEVECQICEKKFQNSHNLRQHLARHNRNPSELVCHICGWEFKEKSNLKQHMESHGNNKTKCDVCNKVLSIRYLQEHMKIHTNFKEFQCATCGKQFVSRERLKRHNVRHFGEPKYKCDLCPKSYTRSDKLLYHRRTHDVLMTHTCQNCGKGFFSIKSLKKHENKHYLEDNGILKSDASASHETKME